MRARVFRLLSRSPSDVSELEALFDRGALDPRDVVAVLGKTEGNGGRNDFTRELASRVYARALAERLALTEAHVHDRVVLSFSGGTEGVASPHAVVFARSGAPSRERRASKRLAIAVGRTRAFLSDEIGRTPQILETGRVVRELVSELALDGPADVHLVQIKGAIPDATFEQAEAARRRGHALRNDMAHSRGASALGVAVALGEVDAPAVTDDAVCSRWDLFSSVASVSAKPGLDRSEILLLGSSALWDGDVAIAHGVMRDILDVDAVRGTLARLGVGGEGADADRLLGVFAKAEADPRGTIRGKRHVMLDDDDIGDTRYSRCTLAAVLASVVGDTAVYVSTRAEHMGPLGGGPVAIVARVGANHPG